MRNNNPSIFQTSGVSSVPQSEASRAARHQSYVPCQFKNGGAIRLPLANHYDNNFGSFDIYDMCVKTLYE